jgi:hypothetical protein
MSFPLWFERVGKLLQGLVGKVAFAHKTGVRRRSRLSINRGLLHLGVWITARDAVEKSKFGYKSNVMRILHDFRGSGWVGVKVRRTAKGSLFHRLLDAGSEGSLSLRPYRYSIGNPRQSGGSTARGRTRPAEHGTRQIPDPISNI